jgi:hypothetical protein
MSKGFLVSEFILNGKRPWQLKEKHFIKLNVTVPFNAANNISRLETEFSPALNIYNNDNEKRLVPSSLKIIK